MTPINWKAAGHDPGGLHNNIQSATDKFRRYEPTGLDLDVLAETTELGDVVAWHASRLRNAALYPAPDRDLRELLKLLWRAVAS